MVKSVRSPETHCWELKIKTIHDEWIELVPCRSKPAVQHLYSNPDRQFTWIRDLWLPLHDLTDADYSPVFHFEYANQVLSFGQRYHSYEYLMTNYSGVLSEYHEARRKEAEDHGYYE